MNKVSFLLIKKSIEVSQIYRTLAYPTSLCMPHTKGTGNYPTNPNWLHVDQCGFGGQFMHIPKSVIGKDSKKSIGLYR